MGVASILSESSRNLAAKEVSGMGIGLRLVGTKFGATVFDQHIC